MNIYDISVTLSEHLPIWPGSPGLSSFSLLSMKKGDLANLSQVNMDVHTGTHIDSPLHFLVEGATTEEIPLERLIGETWVVEVPVNLKTISGDDLSKLAIPENTKSLLLKTANSSNNLWDKKVFDTDFVALDKEGAQWVVDNGIGLIGIDYCSIQKFNDSPETHQILLENEVVILEGIDLRGIDQGVYMLHCLPLKIKGLEGAPARAILSELN